LPSLRDSAAGSMSGAMWDAALDTTENRRFVAAFEARFKRTPSEYAATAFDAANLLDAALAKVNGESIDAKALAGAVKAAGGEFKSVRGPFRFNNNNLPIQNYYVFEAAKDAGRLIVRQIGTPLTAHADAYHTQCTLKQP
jgi:branched-chain amino acid transport system substrate-binding protein